jgi:hypothetical protein
MSWVQDLSSRDGACHAIADCSRYCGSRDANYQIRTGGDKIRHQRRNHVGDRSSERPAECPNNKPPVTTGRPDETFPPEVLGHIPQKTRDDWIAAGQCLAFYLLSASGFHVARAVEGTLEVYYQLFCGRPGQTLHGWRDYHQALLKVVEGAASLRRFGRRSPPVWPRQLVGGRLVLIQRAGDAAAWQSGNAVAIVHLVGCYSTRQRRAIYSS